MMNSFKMNNKSLNLVSILILILKEDNNLIPMEQEEDVVDQNVWLFHSKKINLNRNKISLHAYEREEIIHNKNNKSNNHFMVKRKKIVKKLDITSEQGIIMIRIRKVQEGKERKI